ncbi:hypothetical protein [Chryseobacterium sp. Leaf405]|uniref:hypothetical protein n=1 Tax=Chryseobacterium sp. Leaf405 TaxID=1736367 RepID=UPI001039E2DD|nr:hypothetical protein [Chryseobacterium sp. Leaf405]
MKKTKRTPKKNALIIMIIGMFVIATSQIISHFVKLPDLAKGSFIGIGIGLLILSVIFGNFKTSK